MVLCGVSPDGANIDHSIMELNKGAPSDGEQMSLVWRILLRWQTV